MGAAPSTQVYEFGNFRLDREAGLLRRDATGYSRVPLGSRASEILHLLVARRGALVPKHEIMDLVWPGVAVEEHNLTVQISALRRVLDEGRAGKSCIQNVPGRGYRFVSPVQLESKDEAEQSPAPEPAEIRPPRRFRAQFALLACIGAMLAAAAIYRTVGTNAAQPNLSVAIPAFTTFDNDAVHREMAQAIATDLRTDLVNPGSVLIWLGGRIQASAPTGPKRDQVRYVLVGSLRQFESRIRVTAELRTNDTGASIWADRFDVASDPAAQEAIVRQLRRATVAALVAEEAARSARERPGSEALPDLLVQAYALVLLPPAPDRWARAEALFQQALKQDPNSIRALAGLIFVECDAIVALNRSSSPELLASIEQLMAHAEGLAPDDVEVRFVRAHLLRTERRWEEASAAYQALLDKHADILSAPFMLGLCLLQAGKPAEAIPWIERAIRLEPPEHQSLWSRYQRLGQATLLLGRTDEAIKWYERALAANPGNAPSNRIHAYLGLVAAHTARGETEAAQAALAQVRALDPAYSADKYWSNPAIAIPGYEARIEQLRATLRQAGLPGRSEAP